jgi:uncharacterized membrane protein
MDGFGGGMQSRLDLICFKALFGRLVLFAVCCTWPEASAAVEEAGSMFVAALWLLPLVALGGLFVPPTREEKQP